MIQLLFFGGKVPLVQQDWNAIKSKTKLLWIIGKNQSYTQFNYSMAEHGIWDCVKHPLVENIHGPEKDEWKKDIAELEKNNITQEKLFNPFLRLKGMMSLVLNS